MSSPTNAAALLSELTQEEKASLCLGSYFSEDSLVSGVMGAALVEGLQSRGIGASVKHYAVNNQETDRRLTETVPLRLEDNSAFVNFPGEAGHVRYGEGLFVGYRAYDAMGRDVSYPFGHGLSYTTFDYSNLTAETGDDATVAVRCTVTNTGDRAGKELVQLYVGDPRARVVRPLRELKAFTKVSLEPGAAQTVTFQLSARDLSYWYEPEHRWVLEGGTFELAVGASSRDLRLTSTVDVPAPPLPVRLDAMATLHEWLAHPEGGPALREAVGVDDNGTPRGILGNAQMLAMIGNFPLGRLAAFGRGIDHAMVSDLLRRFGEPA